MISKSGTLITKICNEGQPDSSPHIVAMQLQQQPVQYYKRCSRIPRGTMRSPVRQLETHKRLRQQRKKETRVKKTEDKPCH